MAGPAVRGGVAEAHALGAARVVGCEVLLLRAHEQLRVAVVLGEAVAALGQQTRELAVGVGHHLEAAHDGVGIPELQLGADFGEVFLRNVAALGQLHGRGDGAARRDRIDGVEVAEVVGVENGVELADAAVAAEAEDRLVFGAFAPAAVLAAGLDFGHAGAADRARVTALVPPEDRGGDRRPGDCIGLLELPHLEVVRRQDADRVREADRGGGPQAAKGFRRGR